MSELTIPMIGPDGSVADIPHSRTTDAAAGGYKPAVDMTAPDGKIATIPMNRVHDAMSQGGYKLPGNANVSAGDVLKQFPQQSGVLPGIARAGIGLSHLPGAIYHGVTDAPRNPEEEAIADTEGRSLDPDNISGTILNPLGHKGGTVASRGALAVKRLVIDPGEDAYEKGLKYQKMAEKETDPAMKKALTDAAGAYKIAAFVPLVGPQAADMAQRFEYGPHLDEGKIEPDPSGALAEGITYAAAPKIIGKATSIAKAAPKAAISATANAIGDAAHDVGQAASDAASSAVSKAGQGVINLGTSAARAAGRAAIPLVFNFGAGVLDSVSSKIGDALDRATDFSKKASTPEAAAGSLRQLRIDVRDALASVKGLSPEAVNDILNDVVDEHYVRTHSVAGGVGNADSVPEGGIGDRLRAKGFTDSQIRKMNPQQLREALRGGQQSTLDQARNFAQEVMHGIGPEEWKTQRIPDDVRASGVTDEQFLRSKQQGYLLGKTVSGMAIGGTVGKITGIATGQPYLGVAGMVGGAALGAGSVLAEATAKVLADDYGISPETAKARVAEFYKENLKLRVANTVQSAVNKVNAVHDAAAEAVNQAGLVGDQARSAMNDMINAARDKWAEWTIPSVSGASQGADPPINNMREAFKAIARDQAAKARDAFQGATQTSETPVAAAAKLDPNIGRIATAGEQAGGATQTIENRLRTIPAAARYLEKQDTVGASRLQDLTQQAIDRMSGQHLTPKAITDWLGQIKTPIQFASNVGTGEVFFDNLLRGDTKNIVSLLEDQPEAIRTPLQQGMAQRLLEQSFNDASGKFDPEIFRALVDGNKEKLGTQYGNLKTINEGLASLTKSWELSQRSAGAYRGLTDIGVGKAARAGVGAITGGLAGGPVGFVVGLATEIIGEHIVTNVGPEIMARMLMQPGLLGEMNTVMQWYAAATSKVPTPVVMAASKNVASGFRKAVQQAGRGLVDLVKDAAGESGELTIPFTGSRATSLQDAISQSIHPTPAELLNKGEADPGYINSTELRQNLTDAGADPRLLGLLDKPNVVRRLNPLMRQIAASINDPKVGPGEVLGRILDDPEGREHLIAGLKSNVSVPTMAKALIESAKKTPSLMAYTAPEPGERWIGPREKSLIEGGKPVHPIQAQAARETDIDEAIPILYKEYFANSEYEPKNVEPEEFQHRMQSLARINAEQARVLPRENPPDTSDMEYNRAIAENMADHPKYPDYPVTEEEWEHANTKLQTLVDRLNQSMPEKELHNSAIHEAAHAVLGDFFMPGVVDSISVGHELHPGGTAGAYSIDPLGFPLISSGQTIMNLGAPAFDYQYYLTTLLAGGMAQRILESAPLEEIQNGMKGDIEQMKAAMRLQGLNEDEQNEAVLHASALAEKALKHPGIMKEIQITAAHLKALPGVNIPWDDMQDAIRDFYRKQADEGENPPSAKTPPKEGGGTPSAQTRFTMTNPEGRWVGPREQSLLDKGKAEPNRMEVARDNDLAEGTKNAFREYYAGSEYQPKTVTPEVFKKRLQQAADTSAANRIASGVQTELPTSSELAYNRIVHEAVADSSRYPNYPRAAGEWEHANAELQKLVDQMNKEVLPDSMLDASIHEAAHIIVADKLIPGSPVTASVGYRLRPGGSSSSWLMNDGRPSISAGNTNLRLDASEEAIATLMAGGVAEHLLGSEKPSSVVFAGMRGDLKQIHGFLDDMGIPIDQRQKIIDAASDRVVELLAAPEVRSKIEAVAEKLRRSHGKEINWKDLK